MLLGVGAWSLCEFGAYEALSLSVPYAASSKLLITAGIFNLLVSFLGYWAVLKENRRLFNVVSHLFCFTRPFVKLNVWLLLKAPYPSPA